MSVKNRGGRRLIHTITLINDDTFTVKPYSITRLFKLRKSQRELSSISKEIESIQKEIYDLDEDDNIEGLKEGISDEREEEIDEKIEVLQLTQIKKTIDMCIDGVVGQSKNGVEVTTDYIIEELDISGISEMTSFISGGDAALAEFFRTLISGS